MSVLMDPEVIGKGVSLKTIISNRRQGFYALHTLAAASTPERMDDNIALGEISNPIKLNRHKEVRITFLDVTFGITDDPVDERVVWMLVKAPNNLTLTGADLDHFLDQAVWQRAQNWRLGTAVGWEQTFNQDQIFIGQDIALSPVEATTDAYSMWFIMASTAASEGAVLGVVNWIETLFQRSWPSRNKSEWAGWGYKMEDENYGQYGS